MSVSTYTPDSTKILHTAYADFVSRQIGRTIHVVQYDDSLPLLAVKLFSDGQPYTIPSNAEISIKLGKSDGKFVYNPALGCDSARHTAYFEITYQMVVLAETVSPIIEVRIGTSIAASSSIGVIIDRNPIQREDIESTSEWKVIEQAINYSKEAISAAASASASRSAAAVSESNALVYRNAAQTAATNAANSASAASTSATKAKTSETNAANSASASATSATKSKESETNAKVSETNAKTSETNAKTSETNAANSERKAGEKASEADVYSIMSKSYAIGEGGIRSNEKTDNAKYYSEQASAYEENSELNAKIARSYAVGDTDHRVGENVDNAKYYYQQAKQISEGLGGLIPMGTIAFADLHLQTKVAGYMFNISDEFVSDSTFKDGGDIRYPTGTNVYYTADGYWDCLSGSLLSGIKGNAETEYRKGFVNITPEDIGSYDKESVDNFISGINNIIDTLISRITELEDLSGFAHLIVDDSGSELVTSDNQTVILSI